MTSVSGGGRAPLAERLADVHYFEMPQWAHEAIDEALAALANTPAQQEGGQ